MGALKSGWENSTVSCLFLAYGTIFNFTSFRGPEQLFAIVTNPWIRKSCIGFQNVLIGEHGIYVAYQTRTYYNDQSKLRILTFMSF